jgi:hypothetical protein
MLVQFRELFQTSPSEAMLRYNFLKNDAEAIVGMSHDQLMEMAGKGMLCFEMKVPNSLQLYHVA